MNTQTKQLYEAAKAVIRFRFISHPFVVLREAITAYEQSTEQSEVIAGEKSALEIWKEWCEKDISWTDAASGAMSEYASQQTADRDRQLQVQQSHIDDQDQLIFEQGKKISDLSGELHATDKLNQELQDEVDRLKAEVEKIDFAYKNAEKRYNNAVTQVDELKAEVTALKLVIDELTDGNCLKQSKAKLSGELNVITKYNEQMQSEIKELKAALSELIQVKDWKDKYGKDEHYLKAMPIAWENARKAIESKH